MKSGSRLKSHACGSEVVVIRHTDGAIECGGAAMSEAGGGDAGLNPALAGGTVMGKRYIDVEGTCELLCIKPGRGTLALAGKPLSLKEATPLPASD